MSSDIVQAAAILGLTILEAAAIMTGQDGMYFLPVVAAISGIAGYKTAQSHIDVKVMNAIKKRVAQVRIKKKERSEPSLGKDDLVW